MGVRFRKSVGLGSGVKLNISKKSVGLSAGVKGAHISANSSGRRSVSAGIPGSGLYAVKTLNGRSATSDAGAGYDADLDLDIDDADMEASEIAQNRATSTAFAAALLPVLGVVLIVLSIVLLIIFPVFGIAGIIAGFLSFRYGRKLKNQLKQERARADEPESN